MLELLDQGTVWANRLPPLYVRALLYTYTFTEPGAGDWWRRERGQTYLQPLTRDNRQLVEILR